MGRSLQQRPITPTHSPAPLCLATHAFNCSRTLRSQCYASAWEQAITPGCALVSSNVPGGKTGHDKTHHQAASPRFPQTHRQPFNPYSPVLKRPWPGGKTIIFCRQQDLTRPHQPPPRSSEDDSLLSYVVRFLIVYLADVSNLHNPIFWPFPPFASPQLPPPHCMHNFVSDLCNQPFFLLRHTCIPYFLILGTNQSTKHNPTFHYLVSDLYTPPLFFLQITYIPCF